MGYGGSVGKSHLGCLVAGKRKGTVMEIDDKTLKSFGKEWTYCDGILSGDLTGDLAGRSRNTRNKYVLDYILEITRSVFEENKPIHGQEKIGN